MTRRWQTTAFMVAIGILAGFWIGSLPGLVVFAAFVVLGVVFSPRAFPRSVTDAEARAAQAADGRPIIYWRTGCPFCLRLRGSLGRAATPRKRGTERIWRFARRRAIWLPEFSSE